MSLISTRKSVSENKVLNMRVNYGSKHEWAKS